MRPASQYHPSPMPEALRALELGTFTHHSVVKRLPEIGRQMLSDNNFSPQVTESITSLLQGIPDEVIRHLTDVEAPDAVDWAKYIESYEGQNWLEAPWFFVETYFYRRVLEATGYFTSGPGQGVDPFAYQKQHGLSLALEALRSLADQIRPVMNGKIGMEVGLSRLMVLDLWGNQVDLSLWPVGTDNKPDHSDFDEQQAHILVDDSAPAANHLLRRSDPAKRVDFILDNAGFELVSDLFIAAFLLEMDIVENVYLHAKSHPTFVSDATVKDVQETISRLAEEENHGLASNGRSLDTMIEAGRLRIIEDWFWTSPLEMWLMPKLLSNELEKSNLIICKGDANYRRLLGDRHWPLTTDFAAVVGYAPAPVLALRTLKSEVAIGLKPGQEERIAKQDPSWRVNGRWGVIQFWDGKGKD